VFVGVSHPFVSGAVVSQFAKPALQAVYVQVVPVQAAPALWIVSQASPHALQFVTVFVRVSHPSVSGAVLALQSAKPGEQPVYLHVVPVHVAPVLSVVSHAAPHPPQFITVFVCVSQPFESGDVVTQSAHPGTQPV
jgi:hypothetical protein